VTVEDAFGAGDKVVARWSATMTHKGGQLGIPASGKHVLITGISIGRIVNGKIVEGWDNWVVS
jgi:predicted ester cyclase